MEVLPSPYQQKGNFHSLSKLRVINEFSEFQPLSFNELRRPKNGLYVNTDRLLSVIIDFKVVFRANSAFLMSNTLLPFRN